MDIKTYKISTLYVKLMKSQLWQMMLLFPFASSTTVAATAGGGGGSPLRLASPPNSTAAGASSSSSPLHQVKYLLHPYNVATWRKEMLHQFRDSLFYVLCSFAIFDRNSLVLSDEFRHRELCHSVSQTACCSPRFWPVQDFPRALRHCYTPEAWQSGRWEFTNSYSLMHLSIMQPAFRSAKLTFNSSAAYFVLQQ